MEARLDEMREALETARAGWGERGETRIDSGLDYGDGDPVQVLVRKRGHRYDLTDDGAAVRKANVRGWLPVAEAVVADYWMNINRGGVVCVGAFEGRDLVPLAARIAETSLAVYQELLETQD